jgi:hypothetical protein
MTPKTIWLVDIRLLLVNPPSHQYEGRPLWFGLQDRQGELRDGLRLEDGAQQFECEAQAKAGKDGSADFSGEFIHGKAGERFLYLSLRYADTSSTAWLRRIKIMLNDIPLHALTNESRVILEARVEDQHKPRVHFLEGWTLKTE